eukprot:TRINITY_DN4186_c0_g1_i7.p2 TRINITY_DN4186_c0_g1~~TRINITY_DN4186_c0_g1_i7.p2  ORF type:complete len:100 (-),score=4.33 TRINITY_DN4186_c0_g1_i7:63-362(-)
MITLPIPKNPIAKHGLAVALFGTAFFLLEDGANDIVMYSMFHKKALELALKSERLEEDLGKPFHIQPWYESKIGFSKFGLTAHGSFVMHGCQRLTKDGV